MANEKFLITHFQQAFAKSFLYLLFVFIINYREIRELQAVSTCLSLDSSHFILGVFFLNFPHLESTLTKSNMRVNAREVCLMEALKASVNTARTYTCACVFVCARAHVCVYLLTGQEAFGVPLCHSLPYSQEPVVRLVLSKPSGLILRSLSVPCSTGVTGTLGWL